MVARTASLKCLKPVRREVGGGRWAGGEGGGGVCGEEYSCYMVIVGYVNLMMDSCILHLVSYKAFHILDKPLAV